jgi:hypothetical protein
MGGIRVNALLGQQQAMLDALFAWPSADASQRLTAHAQGVGTQPGRGLLAYQSNGHMLAQRALRGVYPVLAQMLGHTSFSDLARALWHAHPPQRGDVAHWGDKLADFVCSSAQLHDVPYLRDVAMAEWALHRCAFALDQEANLSTLALLTTEDPHTLALDLAPGVMTLSSQWPLASLLLAHLTDLPTLADVTLELQTGVAHDVVIWRAGFQPKLRQALAGELAVLQSLQAGLDMASALQAGPQLDVAQWLPQAVHTGLILGVRHHSFHI